MFPFLSNVYGADMKVSLTVVRKALMLSKGMGSSGPVGE